MDAAAELVSARVKTGETLLGRIDGISDRTKLRAWHQDFRQWDHVNREVLGSVDSTGALRDQYSGWTPIGNIGELLVINEGRSRARTGVTERLTTLQAVLEALPLYAEGGQYALGDGANGQLRRSVMVVYGRDTVNREAIFTFLRSLDLHPIEWEEAVARTGQASPYTGDIVNAAFAMAQAILILLTPDDLGKTRAEFADNEKEAHLSGQARLNVIFEAGMAMALGPERTVIVQIGDVRPFSDIDGRNTVRFDGGTASRSKLLQRLKNAGCSANTVGEDWLTAGEFRVRPRGPSREDAEDAESDMDDAATSRAVGLDDERHSTERGWAGQLLTELAAMLSVLDDTPHGEPLLIDRSVWDRTQEIRFSRPDLMRDLTYLYHQLVPRMHGQTRGHVIPFTWRKIDAEGNASPIHVTDAVTEAHNLLVAGNSGLIRRLQQIYVQGDA